MKRSKIYNFTYGMEKNVNGINCAVDCNRLNFPEGGMCLNKSTPCLIGQRVSI
ncbi:hypothetical protein [Flagellimonas sp. 2504JD1-5]